MELQTYHETLGGTVTHALAYLAAKQAVLRNAEQITGPFQFDGIRYGATKEAHAEIETLKGKPTKKFAHVTIYRMDSGRYELVVYIL